MTKEEIIGKIRRQVETWMPDNPEGDEHISGERIAFRSVLHLLDEIEQEKEPASEDLEKCVVEQMEADGDVDDFVRRGIDDIASKYAQLGAQWQKEQMMKDAIEGEVIDKGDFIKFADDKYIDLNPTMGAEPFIKLEDGDKVKVIIIKE